MLDSDIGNNILPRVVFYERAVKNNFKSEKEGRDIYDMVVFVKIEIPGDRLNVIDQPANEYHKKTYAVQYAHFMNEKSKNGNAESGLSGTLLSDWAILSEAQVKELNHFNFYTVDQIAKSSDEHLSKIVMIVGMGAHAIRQKAHDYITKAKDSAVVAAQSEELRKRDKEIQELREQMSKLMDKIHETPSSEEDKPKRGRPAKVEAE